MALQAVSEADLDLEFASALEADPDFLIWILSGGKFAQYANEAQILIEEQRSARKAAAHWWKHWWCRLPNGTEGETDVFLVLQASDLRFALHIENKPPSGTITLDQAQRYRQRAAFMAHNSRWLNYVDFETLLIAPSSFIANNKAAAAYFDRSVEYEALAAFAPLFGSVLSLSNSGGSMAIR